MTTLYRKYRPQNWADIAGQNHIKVTLAFEVESGRTAHAYLFSGPRGVGKTTIARILARTLNCLDRKDGGEPCNKCESCKSLDESRTLDVIEIDAASHRGIDNIRDNIIENSRFAPASLKYKVFIIDEVHMLTPEAFNALLKTLEEPPEHTIFVLATTELHKVPATIISRCQRFDFRRIPFVEMTTRLHMLAEREGVKVDAKAIEAIARQSDGCLRDAEGLLGKVLTLGDGKRVSYDQALVVLPRSDWQASAGFVEALLKRDGRTALLTLDDCLESGVELDQFASDVIEIFRQLMMMKLGVNPESAAVEADEEQQKRFAGWREISTTEEVVIATEMLLAKRKDLKSAHPPQLPLELAVARICESLPVGMVSNSASFNTVTPVVPATPSTPIATPATPPATPSPQKSSLPREGGNPVVRAEANKTCTVTIERIKEVWSDFITKSGEKSHSLTFLLGCAQPVELNGNCLSIGFNYVFHSDKCNQDKPRKLMEEAMLSILGEKIILEGVVIEKEERDYTCYVTDEPSEILNKPVASGDGTNVAPAVSPENVAAQAAPANTEPEKTADGSYANPGVDALATAFGGKVEG